MSDPFESYTREHFVDCITESFKHIKHLQHQIQEIIASNTELEKKLQLEIERNKLLVEELNKPQGFSFLSRSFSNLFDKPTKNFSFHSTLILNQTPSISDDNPTIVSLRMEIETIRNKFNQSTQNESVLQEMIKGFHQKEILLNEQIDSLQLQLENQIDSKSHADLQEKYISEKVSNNELKRQLENLKEGIKKSMKTCKEKESELLEVQSQLKENEQRLNEIKDESNFLKNQLQLKKEEIASLEFSMNQLNERIENVPPSIEWETRVQKANQMLEKSNQMYVEVQLEKENLKKSLEELQRARSFGLPLMRVKTPKGNFILFENGVTKDTGSSLNLEVFECLQTFQKFDEAIQADLVDYSYTEQLMLQYFKADSKSKKEISEIILKILTSRNFF